MLEKLSKVVLSTNLKITFVSSLAIVALLWITIYSVGYVFWYKDTLSYQAWQKKDGKNFCEKIQTECNEEIKNKSYPAGRDALDQLLDIQSCVKVKQGIIECGIAEPQSLEQRIRALRDVEGLLVVFLIPFYLLYTLKFFFYIKHVGWRRIAFIFSIAASYVIAIEYENNNLWSDALELWLVGLISFLALLALPYLCLNIFQWLREGFTDKEEAKEFISKFIHNKDEFTYYQLGKSYFFGLAKILGVWFIALFLFLLSPAITIKAFIKSSVQLLLIGVVYATYKWLVSFRK